MSGGREGVPNASVSGGRNLKDLLYVRHEPQEVADDALRALAATWLSALEVFGTDALDAGVPTSQVMPAVVQLLEGWMLAHDPSSLATSWAALDATVTLVHLRLQDVMLQRDALEREVARLEALLDRDGPAAPAQRTRRKPRRRKRGGQRDAADRGGDKSGPAS